MSTQVYNATGGGLFGLFPNPIIAARDPQTTDVVSPTGAPYQVFQAWNNRLTDATFIYLGSGNWVTIASIAGGVIQLTGNSGIAIPAAGNINIVGTGTLNFTGAGSTITGTITPGTGLVSTLTGDSGGARPPTSGNINLLGTANQITVTGAASTLTWTIPAVFIAPASIASTTTLTGGTGITATTGNIVASAGQVNAGTSMTAGTSITATSGAITATAGNLVLGTAGNKLVIAAGANASVGTSTLAGGTVTVATTAVTSSSIILISRMSIGATGAAATGNLTVGTVTNATSFVINSVQAADATALQASDVSVVSWLIIN